MPRDFAEACLCAIISLEALVRKQAFAGLVAAPMCATMPDRGGRVSVGRGGYITRDAAARVSSPILEPEALFGYDDDLQEENSRGEDDEDEEEDAEQEDGEDDDEDDEEDDDADLGSEATVDLDLERGI